VQCEFDTQMLLQPAIRKILPSLGQKSNRKIKYNFETYSELLEIRGHGRGRTSNFKNRHLFLAKKLLTVRSR